MSTEYFGPEYELSHHINILYNSNASIYIWGIGAFFISQFEVEKRNKEPSPERVRSERGREDKAYCSLTKKAAFGAQHNRQTGTFRLYRASRRVRHDSFSP